MNKTRAIEAQLEILEKHLACAEEYIAQDINIERSSWFHSDDFKGKSGHPLWMKNFMVPTTKKFMARKEKALERIERQIKDKSLEHRIRTKERT